MKKLSLVLIGMGRIGRIHLNNILRQFPEVTISGVADKDYPADKFAQEYGAIPFSQDAEELIAQPGVDAVLICTPTSTHAAMIRLALKYEKHIFCEKPVDLSLETTKELVDQVTAAGIKLMLGFNRRFDPDFLHAHRQLTNGRIGEVQIVKITSRDPGLPPIDYIKNSGGLFMDMVIHDFDMARYLMGKEVREVYAQGRVLVDPKVGEAGDIDTALTTLIFEDDSYAVIDNSREAIYGYDQRLEIFGNKGMLQVENNLHNKNIVYDQAGIHHSQPLDFFMDRYAASYLNEMKFFINALLNGQPIPVSGQDGLEAVVIATAAKWSVEKKRPVSIAEVKAIL
ncbi:inositol 2-dehydrogenase [Flavihumibacter sp. CACIAM 22H1]|uniref:inositol 2-dehydrogenase n=1 Tax=Flavihumibacter sp. CACIAM 22H1 TaxID=1812911 RepID=UPI0007A7E9FF|nr:inositol 2-dehydrogenase [Flavihumibacter sp. CACIAM 22H1]KYP15471.1 MAG: inositol 2-dehydrogenase [Flavihumibacter sp. CACIAM 22H1]